MVQDIISTTKTVFESCGAITANPSVSESFGIFTCTLGNLISALRNLVIGLGLLFVVIAGIQFITSNGNPEKLNQARQTMIWAIVAIVLSAILWSLLLILANLFGVPGIQPEGIQLNEPPTF